MKILFNSISLIIILCITSGCEELGLNGSEDVDPIEPLVCNSALYYDTLSFTADLNSEFEYIDFAFEPEQSPTYGDCEDDLNFFMGIQFENDQNLIELGLNQESNYFRSQFYQTVHSGDILIREINENALFSVYFYGRNSCDDEPELISVYEDLEVQWTTSTPNGGPHCGFTYTGEVTTE